MLFIKGPAMGIRLIFVVVLTWGASPCSARVLWYGGDSLLHPTYNNTSAKDGSGSCRVLEDFEVPAGVKSWHVTGLFSNNFADYPMSLAPFTEAEWSIRTGVGPGDPGTILYGGISPVTIIPTGRSSSDGTEYRVVVSGLSVDLAPGVYFFTVSPLTERLQIYYVSISTGENSVGPPGPVGFYQECGPDPFWVHYSFSATHASLGVIGHEAIATPGVPAMSAYGTAFLVLMISIAGAAASRLS